MPSKKLKILRIIARLNIGGPAIHVINLTHYLNNEQFESKLVIGKEADFEGNMLDLAAEKNVAPIVLPELGRELNFFKDIKTLWKLYKIIRKEKPDIVHTHTAKAGTLGRLAAKLAGVKNIYHTFHGHIFHSYFGRLKTALFLLIERFLARFTTKIIVISERQKQELLKLKIAPLSKFSVIPLGFELDKFKELVRTNYLRDQLSIGGDEKLVGIIGRLAPVKNHHLLIPIMQAVQKKQQGQVKLVIIGNGELEEQLKGLVKDAGLENVILFSSWQKDLAKVYPDLDLVILTSLNEGTPVTLIEAMACGIPVISTDVGGVGDVVKNGESGILENKENTEKFAEDIIELLSNNELREKYIKNAKKHVFETYAVNTLVENIRNLYLRT
ncbi:glycosyltransferase family 4 protein [Candidatus Margulisiibacteriota bacterium]